MTIEMQKSNRSFLLRLRTLLLVYQAFGEGKSGKELHETSRFISGVEERKGNERAFFCETKWVLRKVTVEGRKGSNQT